MRKRDQIRQAKTDYEGASYELKDDQRHFLFAKRRLKKSLKNKRLAKRAWLDSMK